MINKDKFEFCIFRGFKRIARIFGIARVKYLAFILAVILYYLIPLRKKVVLNNLKTAFPFYSKKQIKKISFQNYYNFTIVFFEMMCMSYISRETLHSCINCINLELIRQKYDINKRLILLTAHLGNWELGAASASSQLGIPFNVLAKPQRNPYMTNWLKSNRERFGNKEILLGLSARDIFIILKNGGIVGVLGDQRGPIESPRVKFFGRDTAINAGIAAIALKTNTPVITAMIIRQPNGLYNVYLEELKLEDLMGTKEEQIVAFNQKYMSILEKYVTKHPEQWFWMHNIWKY